MSPTYTITPTVLPYYPNGGYAEPNLFVPTFGAKTKFVFKMTNIASTYTIRIMNLRDKIVRTLHNEQVWDGRSENGRVCKGGVYIYQIEAENKRVTGKVVLIK